MARSLRCRWRVHRGSQSPRQPRGRSHREHVHGDAVRVPLPRGSSSIRSSESLLKYLVDDCFRMRSDPSLGTVAALGCSHHPPDGGSDDPLRIGRTCLSARSREHRGRFNPRKPPSASPRRSTHGCPAGQWAHVPGHFRSSPGPDHHWPEARERHRDRLGPIHLEAPRRDGIGLRMLVRERSRGDQRHVREREARRGQASPARRRRAPHRRHVSLAARHDEQRPGSDDHARHEAAGSLSQAERGLARALSPTGT